MIKEETEAVICLAWETRGQEYADGIRDGFATVPAQPWDWVRKARLACRLILDPDSLPRDMVNTLTEHWGPTTGPKASQAVMNAALAQMRGDLTKKAEARQKQAEAQATERARKRAEELAALPQRRAS